MIAINGVSFILGRIIFPSLYIFSLIIVFPADINILLFKCSLIIGFIVLGLLMLSLSNNINDTKRDLIIFIIFMFLSGLLIGTLMKSDSINLLLSSSEPAPFLIFNLTNINYTFSLICQITIILFLSYLFFVFIYYGFLIHIHSRDKALSKNILLTNIFLCISFLVFIFYIITEYVVFREFYFIIIQIILLFLLIQYTRKQGVPIINITSKIFSINIYHKSGVQLYSYKFEYDTPKTESSIWGNILIGLNHIIGEFIDTNNQINVMQTKNSDIIVEYNNNYGFAVLLTTNKKNFQLSKMMKEFTEEFESIFKKELIEIQDLNNLIDISEFKGVEELIKKHFSTYF